jgi:hypothetical protein
MCQDATTESHTHVERGRLAEHEPADHGPATPGETQAHQPLQDGAHRDVRLEAGEVHPDADVRAAGEREVAPGVRASRLVGVGIVEGRRVPVRGGDRDPDEIARGHVGVAEVHVGGRVAVDDRRRRLQAQRLLDGGGQQGRIRPDLLERRRMSEEVDERVADHPLHRLDAAEEHDGGVRGVLGVREPVGAPGVRPHGSQRLPERRDGLGRRRPFRTARGEVGDGGDDRVVPGEDGVRLRAVEAEAPADHRRGERPGEVPPELRRAARAELGEQACRHLDDVRAEPPPDLAEAQRRDERRAVPRVLRSIEGEHARPDHLRGGEPRVLDGERPRVAHHREREVTAGDEPAVERRQPGDGLALAQRSEPGVRLGLELGDGRRGADRESETCPRRVTVRTYGSARRRGSGQ